MLKFYIMSLYDLPEIKVPKIKRNKEEKPHFSKSRIFWLSILIIFSSSLFGFLAGAISGAYFYLKVGDYLSRFNIEIPEIKTIIEKEYIPQTTQEEAIIKVVSDVSPAVVSIVATKDVSVIGTYYYNPFEGLEDLFGYPFEFQVPQYYQQGTERQEIGGGTGFIVSEDGMIITNKHVVLDEEADYTVFTNDGKNYPAKVVAKDPIQDIALIKIDQEKIVDDQGGVQLKSFRPVILGDSDNLQIGQTVIAIGNALGEYRNTVSVGVVSGLGRTITASGGGLVETIEDVIQTDTAINRGNSGGPLLNLKGEVIGINTATVLEAQSIGFSIPINKAKKDIEQVKETGKIVYPFIGIRYVIITGVIQQENDLPVDYGAWIIAGNQGESAIEPDSAAEIAGLQENDIILEFGGEKITTENSLAKIIQKYNPGDIVVLKTLRDGKERVIPITLGERNG